MSERFPGYDFVGFSRFTPVKGPASRIEPNRKISRLHESPGQKGVTVFTVALAFFLAVTPPTATDTPTIRGIVADFPETLHRACFIQNRPCKHISNTGERLQKMKNRVAFRLFQYGLFDATNLLS
jgi:hypothetical protein